MDTSDILGSFKAKACELLDSKNDYFGGTYMMSLTKEAGLGIVKRRTGDQMMSTLARSVEPFTAQALAVAFIGVEMWSDKGEIKFKDKALLLLCVDKGTFSVWRRPIAEGPWTEITDSFDEGTEAEVMMEIYNESSFDLSATEAVPEKIVAGVTII